MLLQKAGTGRMSGDELAAKVYAERGYLVMATNREVVIGTAQPHMRGANGVSIIPLVKSKTTEADYLEQLRRVRELDSGIPTDIEWLAKHYYRVEAAD